MMHRLLIAIVRTRRVRRFSSRRVARLAPISRAERFRNRRGTEAAGRARPGQEREMESRGPQRPVVADRRRRQARHHRVRKRQALHDRLQPRRRQRSLAGRSAATKSSNPSTKSKAARPLLRARPTASTSFPTSAPAACSATTSPARNCGSTKCRRPQTLAGFGTGVSPIIADGMVVLMRDVAKDPKIIALDVATGNPKWEKKRESKSSFGTPTVWNTPQGKHIVAPGFGKMIGYNLQGRRRSLVRRRHAVRLLHDARRGRRQPLLRRLVARRPGRQGLSDAHVRCHLERRHR